MNNFDLKLHKSEALSNTYKPDFFYLKNNEGINAFNDFIKDEQVRVYDHLYGQLKELMKVRNPKIKLKPEDYQQLIATHLNGCPIQQYGVWVYYPWSGNMVHILDKDEFIELRTSANRNKITYEERDILATKKVGVIGLSVGQSVSVTLAMERGCGELRIADFDTIELNNLNRLRTGLHNLGVLKAYCVAREIAEIDPFFNVVCYTDGITGNNIDDFFTKDGNLDIVIDECDAVDVKIRCRLKAKEYGVPVLMEASDRGTVDVERYDLEPNRPIMHGWLEHLSLDLDFLKTLKTSEEKLPYILPISGLETLSPRMKASMIEIEQTITTWPQLASAVALGGAVTADTCRRIFLDQYTASGRYFIDMEKLIPDERPDNEPHRLETLKGTTTDDIEHLVNEYHKEPSITQADPGQESIKEFVKAASTAPTGGNAQQWKWHYYNKNLYLFIHSEYAPKLIDFANTASYIGLGAATENLIIKAQQAGYKIKIDKFPLGTDSKLIAVFSFYDTTNVICLDDTEPEVPWSLADVIEKRTVNRRIVAKKTIEHNKLDYLVEVARSMQGADMKVITDEREIAEIGDVMAMADRIRIMNKTGHLEFLAETMWTKDEALRTRKGIDINTLDLTPSEIVGFRMAKEWDVINHLNKWNGGDAMEKLTRKTANAASAIGLVTMPAYSMQNIFDGGRALERVWLAATKDNIAFQPLSVSIFLFHRYKHEGLTIFSKNAADDIVVMRRKFENVFSLSANECEILMFRLFLSEYPEARSLRANVDEVLSFR